jgi:SAM-dependent methyltransferase
MPAPSLPDPSNGYEAIAFDFIRARDTFIGPSVVREWARDFPSCAEVLELACGHGVVSQVLVDSGLKLFALDASPTLLRVFQERLPGVPTVCEPAEASTFFNRTFDGIVAWGLLFLMEERAQRTLLGNAARALRPGGRFLCTAPSQVCTWTDIMTGQPSRSLGAQVYEELLRNQGLDVTHGVTDQGENYYYFATRPSP